MSTTPITTHETQPDGPIDVEAAVALLSRIHSKPTTPVVAVTPKFEEAAPVVPKVEEATKASTRAERRASQREEIQRVREENARLQGRLEALESGRKTESAPSKEEIKRENFKTDAEYQEAITRKAVDERMAAKEVEAAQLEEMQTRREEADENAKEHAKLIDFDDVLERASDINFDRPKMPDGKYGYGLFEMEVTLSPYRMFLIEHLVNHPEEFEKLRLLEKSNAFLMSKTLSRLEGKMEGVYNQRQEAARAAKPEKVTEKVQKTGSENTPEKERAAAASDGNTTTRLPKPSSEVAAKGGTAPAGEPPIHSQAWMEKYRHQRYGK